MIKIVFSKYCSMGVYGNNCRCKKCCDREGIEYDELTEFKYYVYGRVITGDAFVIDHETLQKFASDQVKEKLLSENNYLFIDYSKKESADQEKDPEGLLENGKPNLERLEDVFGKVMRMEPVYLENITQMVFEPSIGYRKFDLSVKYKISIREKKSKDEL